MKRHVVLIVEDKKVIAEGLIELVELLGHKAIHVTSMEEALKVLETTRVCYVLLDLEIKRMRKSLGSRIQVGQALLREIRVRFPGRTKDQRYHYLVVIIVSGHDEHDTVVKGIRDGADAFVKKPLRQNNVPIDEQIKTVLEKSGRATHDRCAKAHKRARAGATARAHSAPSDPAPSSATAVAEAAEGEESRPTIVRERTTIRIEFRGRSASFKLMEGFIDLALLFLHEGREIASDTLALRPALGGISAKRPTANDVDIAALVQPGPGKRGGKGRDSDSTVDERTIEESEARIAELQALGTAEALEEADFIRSRYLDPALDRRGQPRSLNSAGHSKRVTVQKRVKKALALIEIELPELWKHLGGDQIFAKPRRSFAALTFGQDCSYKPTPPMHWLVRI